MQYNKKTIVYSQQGSDRKSCFMNESVMFLCVGGHGMVLIGCLQYRQLSVFVENGNSLLGGNPVFVSVEFKHCL